MRLPRLIWSTISQRRIAEKRFAFLQEFEVGVDEASRRPSELGTSFARFVTSVARLAPDEFMTMPTPSDLQREGSDVGGQPTA